MDNIFLKIFNLSLTAGVIVIAVLLVRLLLGRALKAPKWINCVLWVIVALRLVIPWTPKAPFGVMPAGDIVSIERVEKVSVSSNASVHYSADIPVVSTGIAYINDSVNPGLEVSLTPAVGDSADPIRVVLFIGTIIWLAGVSAMLIYAAVSWIRVKRRVREAVPAGSGVFETDRIETPFILGIFRPVIYIPAASDEKCRHIVLAHERAHLKRHDHWWKPLGFLLLTIYWFNPLLWLAYILLCRDIEMACDEKVIADMENEAKKEYSETLLSLSVPHRMISVCPVAFGEVGVKGRIKNVLNYRKPVFRIVIVAIVICVVLGAVLLTGRSEKSNAGAEALTDTGSANVYASAKASENSLVSGIYAMTPSALGLVGVYADYFFVPIADKSYRYSMLSEAPANVTKGIKLLECIEDDGPGSEFLWEIYSLEEYPGHEAVLGVCEGQSYLLGYSPSLRVSEQDITDVMNGEFVVMENGSAVSGKELWEAFLAATQEGNSARVNIAYVYRQEDMKMSNDLSLATQEDYPQMYCSRLTFDGNRYTIEPFNKIDGDYVVYELSGIDSPAATYNYLMHYTGKPSSQTARFISYDKYVLTNDNTVTWSDIEKGMYSSQIGDGIAHREVYNEYEWKTGN